MEKHSSARALVVGSASGKSGPDRPVYCLRPHAAHKAAEFFIRHFPGDVLYALKANPHPAILDAIYAAGVRRFDVASIPEIQLAAEQFSDASIAFMHPVKARTAIARAYFDYSVRTFALDSLEELAKIAMETKGATDINLMIRLAVPSDYAQHKLDGKFGASGAEAVLLLREARAIATELGVSFHVGSQCMRPEAWRVAMGAVSDLIRQAGVTVDIVNVGGGFPAAYPGLTPPPLINYIDEIEACFGDMPVLQNATLWCEPGRALCAEAASHIVRVDLRKGDALYINDGSYGALFDAAHCGLVFPATLLRGADSPQRPLQPFRLYGPTCDAIDAMEGPFLLPADVGEGDYIEIGLTGAYGATLATKFNGFGDYQEVILSDAPMTSMYERASVTEQMENIITFKGTST